MNSNANPPPPPRREPVAPYLVLAAFVVLLLSPSVIAAATLAAAGIGTAIVRRARAGAATTSRAGAPRRARAPGRDRLADPDSALDPASPAPLGTTDDGRLVHLSDHQLSAHTLILGASGSGKSTTLLKIATDQVRRGHGIVAIDMKGAPDFAAELEAAAKRAGRPFRLWTLDGPGHWNPLANGNPAELKDRLISAERWTEPHYQRAAERYVQTVLQIWQQARPDRTPTLRDIVDLMDHRRLVVMLRDLPSPALGSGAGLPGITRPRSAQRGARAGDAARDHRGLAHGRLPRAGPVGHDRPPVGFARSRGGALQSQFEPLRAARRAGGRARDPGSDRRHGQPPRGGPDRSHGRHRPAQYSSPR